VAYVDLSFGLRGEAIPLDHGYPLYAALSGVLSKECLNLEVGVHPVKGTAGGDGTLSLGKGSCLTIRMPSERIPDFLPLAGRSLEVEGHSIRVGVPKVLALKPAATLAARMVTIKGFMEPAEFLEAARRQMDSLGISGEATVGVRRREAGRDDAGEPIRRVLRIKDRSIVGFSVLVAHLTAEESLKLQEQGLGGRRHMGCGVFVPVP